MTRVRWGILGLVALAALLLSTGACSTLGYLGQAALGQAKILCARRPIERWIADPATPRDLRSRLEVAQSARAFAVENLSLPDQGYRSYVELPRNDDGTRPRAVVWNVFAAPELSLDPVTWCFPIAGCVVYRGYFRRDAAERFASELDREGFDVSVGGASAYSTLGWFSDPLLSTVIEDPPLDIVALLFHELAHLVVYIPGDSELNESFATVVEAEGLRRWIEAGHAEPEEAENRRSRQHLRERWNDLLLRARTELEVLYTSSDEAGSIRRRKSEVLSAAADECRELLERPAGDPACELNNADLVAVGAYLGLVPALERALAEVEGSLPRFYDHVLSLKDLPQEERRSRLRVAATSTDP